MHPNAALLTEFYESFARHDGDAMASCYHPDATFSDPVFQNLDGRQAGDMWRMLTGQASDLRIEFSDVEADETSGRAHWEAWYPLPATGRPVHNIIEARFRFRDHKIIEHVDEFDFWRWSRQALGLPGLLFGWSSLLQKTVSSQATGSLEKFREK